MARPGCVSADRVLPGRRSDSAPGRNRPGRACCRRRRLGCLVGLHAAGIQLFAGALWGQGDTRHLRLRVTLSHRCGDYFGRVAKRLEDEEHLRQLAVQELAHRLKNKIATIQAIISVQLRDQPQVRSDILDRLAALTATDHLIEQANGQGAFVRDIAETEIGPYVGSRVTVQGPNVLLPPKFALTVALLLHELATNSAKYGSLSVSEGRVSLLFDMSDDVLHLTWRERDGPPVHAPQKHGFGLRLLSRALEPFGGGAEILFEPTGVVCNMRLTLPMGARSEPLGEDDGQKLSPRAT